ncbi:MULTISPECIES: DUF3084 domain-containing protein [Synechocystis]|uniref:DUF3084 domain-containing protein n=1 Tax=Synechocystis salina LEGE 00031 TaxID=1828736 RepID=A0ABR9VSU9_9SYNC|nr:MULTISPECIES: DUF3084 domain-containing protein [Synechocystis]MBD2654275.1 DUF3084 domain-containing protein [Synechocystis sp. FACHB-383]MBE9194910.1 DUF3084 domain-containing protein [Synechocystis sp. LEGE 06083]MBE9240907.1 DUF3084 domain-containing protein [Synechocystis salina LEGE 00041]MBE9254409.1 DUF3084 domain-containing protein [Synechocystis salina LEGE 00031]
MTSAYILVLSVLVLGGIIAALGDHLGSKVGKARLRLFTLRPRQTAVVLTVITGTLISASTLGILFTFSKSLREGVFQLDDILGQLRVAKAELEQASQAKEEIESELSAVRQEQKLVQERSRELDRNYTRALQLLRRVSQQSRNLRQEVTNLSAERAELNQQKDSLLAEATELQSQVKLRDQELSKRQERIAQQEKVLARQQEQVKSLEQRFASLEAQRQQLQAEINQRDTKIDQLDQAIAAKDNDIQVREEKLQGLETELSFLQREVEELERYYQDYQELRGQQIAILRGQLLAFGGLKVVSTEAVSAAVDQLLRQANRTALQLVKTPNMPVPDEPIVRVTTAQVDSIKNQLQPGQEYVIRVLSAGNYVQEEREIRVFFDVVPNRQVFRESETIATISLESSDFSEVDVQKRIDYLLAAAQFRARREGILGPIQVEDGRIKTLIDFIEQLRRQSDNPPNEVRAIAAENTSVVGPLKIRIIALRGNEIVFEN